MATQDAPIDRAERDLASAQLDELAMSLEGQPWAVWKDAMLTWHLRRFATAHAEAWIPGFADYHEHDPMIEKFLSRFYRHHTHVVIRRLRAENVELRRKVLDAAACARFYASGEIDAGEHANSVLRTLLSPAASGTPTDAHLVASHRSGLGYARQPGPLHRKRTVRT